MRHRPRVVPSEPPPASRVLVRWGREERDLLFNFCTRAFCTLALVAAFWLSAQAQEAVPLARGNTPGEPHHHLKLENEYVRVYYVEVPPHENTQLHQHDHDYIYVSLGPADVVNAIQNKPEIHLQLKDGETHFTRGGFAHVARNLADTPFRNITIELLKTQEDARNECGEVILNQAGRPCHVIDLVDVAIPEFETAEVKLDYVTFFPSEKWVEKASKLAFLVIGLDGTGVKVNKKGESQKTLRGGEVEWFDAGSNVEFSSNGGKRVGQFLKLTLKDSAPNTTP